jgi:hypothetical protein
MVNGPLTANRYNAGTYRIAESMGCDVALANSTNGDILLGLADRPGSDMTARLLLALTALYVERPTHTPQEQQQYAELALRLIGKVDDATRTAAAGMLRRHPDAPAEILGRLDQPSAPSHTARQAVETPASPASEGAPEIAASTAVPPHAPAGPTAPPQVPAPSELGEAFFASPADERRRLLTLIPPDADHVAPAPDDGERIYEGLDAAAMQGRIGEFTREFERLLAMPKSLCERILNDRSGEPMVVVAKAAGMPIAVLQRILLLVNPAVSHSVQRVYDLTDLYHGLDRGTAHRLLALWRADAKPNDPVAEPKPDAIDRKAAGLRDAPGLRSRFGALTERLQGQGVTARPDPGSVARRDLRSR